MVDITLEISSDVRGGEAWICCYSLDRLSFKPVFSVHSMSNNQSLELFWFNFYFLFIYFKKFLFYFLTLQYCIGFAIYQNESATGVHVFPIPNPPYLLPPHTILLGRPSAPAPSIQYCALNPDWRLVSYMILYMFQCHSPKSSHPLPLPQSPKDCSIHQCLFCCLI